MAVGKFSLRSLVADFRVRVVIVVVIVVIVMIIWRHLKKVEEAETYQITSVGPLACNCWIVKRTVDAELNSVHHMRFQSKFSASQ